MNHNFIEKIFVRNLNPFNSFVIDSDQDSCDIKNLLETVVDDTVEDDDKPFYGVVCDDCFAIKLKESGHYQWTPQVKGTIEKSACGCLIVIKILPPIIASAVFVVSAVIMSIIILYNLNLNEHYTILNRILVALVPFSILYFIYILRLKYEERRSLKILKNLLANNT